MTEQKEKSKAKRIISVICTVLTSVIFVFVALLLINMIVCRVQNKPVNFFGTSFAVVQTNSMEPEIMTGDLIVFKKIDFSEIEVSDNIVFRADENFRDGNGNSMSGLTIVHKVVEKTQDGLVTRGVHNLKDDGGFRTEDEIYGVCISNSAAWGKIFSFLGKYGILIIIALIAVPIIVSQTIKIIKLSKAKNAEGEAQIDTGDMLVESNKGDDTDEKADKL